MSMFLRNRGTIVAASLVLGTLGGFFLNSASRPIQAEPKLPPAIPQEMTSYRDIVKGVVPAVVSIESRARAKRGLRLREDNKDRSVELGLGSGVIVDPKGTVLTN